MTRALGYKHSRADDSRLTEVGVEIVRGHTLPFTVTVGRSWLYSQSKGVFLLTDISRCSVFMHYDTGLLDGRKGDSFPVVCDHFQRESS